MDGNGRWAKKRLMPRTMGHRAGMSALKRLVKSMGELNIPYLTVFAFSTENWRRPTEEVDYLMNLLVEYLFKELQELHENNVKINILGDYRLLPPRCRLELEEALKKTRNNDGLTFSIALNYGARHEILAAVKKAAALVAGGKMSADAIDEGFFSSLLSTADLPDPDLLIRTAGEMRISNFLLWQIAYTEIWVTQRLWPDFSQQDLLQAIADFKNRDRRFGGLSRQDKGEKHV
ncbi:MAG TPA: isoprenyl transferase [Syntrophomonas sp.]|jgi:undecaprenyl diphosphate synthase|nr:isoprenyl transferase [Syntrophomonas sp.]